jgi:hypothetical protein
MCLQIAEVVSELYVTNLTPECSEGAKLYTLLGHGCTRNSSRHVHRAVKYLKKAYAVTKRNLVRVDWSEEKQRLLAARRKLEEQLAANKAALRRFR